MAGLDSTGQRQLPRSFLILGGLSWYFRESASTRTLLRTCFKFQISNCRWQKIKYFIGKLTNHCRRDTRLKADRILQMEQHSPETRSPFVLVFPEVLDGPRRTRFHLQDWSSLRLSCLNLLYTFVNRLQLSTRLLFLFSFYLRRHLAPQRGVKTVVATPCGDSFKNI